MADEPFESVRLLEAEIGVEIGFFEALLREPDDWSFVIKLHAVFEAAVAFWLSEELGRRELWNVFSYTELSRDKTGKVEIATALGLLTKKERRYLRSLSELRNKLVHDVKNTRFTFERYLADMTTDQRSAFYERFELDLESDSVEIDGNQVPRKEIFLSRPRLGIWIGAIVLLEYFFRHKELTKAQRELEAEKAKFAEWFRKPFHTRGKLPGTTGGQF